MMTNMSGMATADEVLEVQDSTVGVLSTGEPPTSAMAMLAMLAIMAMASQGRYLRRIRQREKIQLCDAGIICAMKMPAAVSFHHINHQQCLLCGISAETYDLCVSEHGGVSPTLQPFKWGN